MRGRTNLRCSRVMSLQNANRSAMATLSMPSPSWADTEHPAATSATNVLAQPFPIARSYLLAVPFTDLGPFEEPAAASVGNNDIGVIAGEHDAVRTDDVECPLQVALAEYSSWRDEDVAAKRTPTPGGPDWRCRSSCRCVRGRTASLRPSAPRSAADRETGRAPCPG